MILTGCLVSIYCTRLTGIPREWIREWGTTEKAPVRARPTLNRKLFLFFSLRYGSTEEKASKRGFAGFKLMFSNLMSIQWNQSSFWNGIWFALALVTFACRVGPDHIVWFTETKHVAVNKYLVKSGRNLRSDWRSASRSPSGLAVWAEREELKPDFYFFIFAVASAVMNVHT